MKVLHNIRSKFKDKTVSTKYINAAFILLLILIPLSVGIYLRALPYYMPSADSLAQSNIDNYLRQSIAAEVNSKFAYLPDENKKQIIDEEVSRFYSEQQPQIQALVQQSASQIRNAFRNDKGETYLNDIDTWMQYYFARNYVEYGHSGDINIDGKDYSIHRDGRFNFPEPPRFHPWMMAQWHFIYTIFDSDASVMKSTWFFNVFFAVLAVIPAFFIGRRFAGNFAGFIAAMFIAMHTAILSRTIGGFADTDTQNLVWPMFVLWFLIEAFEAESKKAKVIYSSLAGVFMGFYSLGWTSGWWHTFVLFVVAICAYIIHLFIKARKHINKEFFKSEKIRGILFEILPYIAASIISVVAAGMIFLKYSFGQSVNIILKTFLGPMSFIYYKSVGVSTIWPNVLTTVAELNLAGLDKIISMMGGKILFFFALAGFALLLINKKSSGKEWKFVLYTLLYYALLIVLINKIIALVEQDAIWFAILVFLPWIVAFILASFKEYEFSIFSSLLLGLYLVVTIYAATRGIRFTALLAMPFALLIGIAAGKVLVHGNGYFEKMFSSKSARFWTGAGIIAVLVFLIIPSQLNSAMTLSRNELSSMNDAWYDSLTYIKDNSPSGKAIITSWWDFGHWFVAIAERSVNFDGGNQGKRIHWVGRTLATDNEQEAIDILRMLNCGQEHSYNLLYEKTKDEYYSVSILYQVMRSDKESAKKLLLEEGFSEKETEELMKFTHYCEPWQQFFIASEDMVGKGAVWAHFGLWDFNRAYMFNKVKGKSYEDGIRSLTTEFNLSKDVADKIYYEIKNSDGDQWIMDWPGYESVNNPCSRKSDFIACSNGFTFNMTSKEGFFMSEQGKVYPNSVVYIDDEGRFTRAVQKDANIDKFFGRKLAIIITKNLESTVSDDRLAASMFTRMFFFDGAGLEHFKLGSVERGIDGSEIKVFEVAWPDEK